MSGTPKNTDAGQRGWMQGVPGWRGRWHGNDCRHAPRGRTADAAHADDGAVGLHGLLPAAMSSGIGSQVQRPLATVVVGGMLIGPVIMLVVVPALQTLFLEWTERPGRETREDGEDLAEV